MSTDLRQLIHDTLKSGVLAPEKGKPKTTLQALGWTDALESYQPFLSYNELGSMLDEGPSKLYDALSLVLGLEDLVNAQTAESPFRFVVIDDPVKSMDPSRVDGLVRAFEETALTRQVIVFTHDERLPDLSTVA